MVYCESEHSNYEGEAIDGMSSTALTEYEYMLYPEDTEREYRGYKLVRERQFLLWEIKALHGGDLPLELTSKFTTLDLCQQFLDKYLDGD